MGIKTSSIFGSNGVIINPKIVSNPRKFSPISIQACVFENHEPTIRKIATKIVTAACFESLNKTAILKKEGQFTVLLLDENLQVTLDNSGGVGGISNQLRVPLFPRIPFALFFFFSLLPLVFPLAAPLFFFHSQMKPSRFFSSSKLPFLGPLSVMRQPKTVSELMRPTWLEKSSWDRARWPEKKERRRDWCPWDNSDGQVSLAVEGCSNSREYLWAYLV